MEKKIYPQLDSTNAKCQSLIEKGEITGTSWIQTMNQVRGKGLAENTWESEPGKNLTGSLVIFPKLLPAEDQFDISIMASLAVGDLLSLYCENIRIKWPNDILAGSSKIAGLLVENAVSGKYIQHSVIGIGLNINQTKFQESIPNPVSLKMLMSYDFDLAEISDLLLGFLSKRFQQLESTDSERLRAEYLQNLFRYKEFFPYRAKGKWFNARITDIDPYGRLILESEQKEVMAFGFKEVEFID